MLVRLNTLTFHRSIRATLVVLLLVVMVPIVLIEPFLHFQQLEERRGEELLANLEVARLVAARVDGYVGDILRQEMLIGLAGTAGPPRPARISRLLLAAANEHPSVGSFAWIDDSGRVLTSSDAASGDNDASQEEYFRLLAEGRESVVSDLWLARDDGQPVFTIARAVRDDSGALVAVVAAMVDAQFLSDLLNVERTGHGSVMIADRNGRAVFRYPVAPLSWDEREMARTQPIMRSALAGVESAGSLSLRPGESQRLGAFVPIRSIGWAAGASRPSGEILSGAYEDFVREFSAYILVGCGAFLVALWMGRSLTRPIRRLRAQAEALERNAAAQRVKVGGPSDLRQLAGAFNSMADSVEARTRELELVLEAVHTVAGADDIDVALYELSSLLARAVNVPICRVALLAKGERKLVLRAAYSALTAGRPTFLGKAFPIDDVPPARKVLEERAPVAVESPESPLISETERLRWKASGLQSALGVPLMARDHVIGLLMLGDVRPRLFTDAEKRLSLAMARQAGVAIEKAELHKQVALEMKRLDAVVRHASDGIALVDAERRVVTLNPAMEALVGWTAEAAREKPCRDIFRGHDDKGACICDTACPMLRPLRPGEAVPYTEMTVATKDGQTRQLSLSHSQVRMGSTPEYGVMIARDITRLKEIEKLKDEFVSLLSHDLRQPVAVIQGFAQVLRLRLSANGGDQNTLHHCDMIVAGTRRMGAMIGDLVDSARLESGRMVLKRSEVSLPELVAAALRTRVEGAHRVRFEVEPGVPALTADAERLERVVANLVNNALKYSGPEKAVFVRVRSAADEVVTEVADQGPGIDAEELPRVFERFYRARTARDREGLGMGLYISRLLIEAHGGRIWAESRVGEGSVFCFALPAVPSASSEAVTAEVRATQASTRDAL